MLKRFPTPLSVTKVESKNDNKYDVEGNLTIKGITKPVVPHTVLNKQDMHPMVKKGHWI